MDRRSFLKKSALITFGAGLNIAVPKKILSSVSYPDIAAVSGGTPQQLFDMGIEMMGGIKRFVKKNKTVVIKPNIGWEATPERAANTNPQLVMQIVKQCLDAGAKKVYVFDHTTSYWQRCYELSGIKHSVNLAGGTMVPANNERYYKKIRVEKGKILKETHAHELFLEADILINVPVLKHHHSTNVTIGMKNLMGVVWDRYWWHSYDLHQCIADFATYRIPDLTVVDAYRVLKKNGPMGVYNSDSVLMKAIILSTDPVAADTASSKLMGKDPGSVEYLKLAQDHGIGTMDLNSLKISKLKV